MSDDFAMKLYALTYQRLVPEGVEWLPRWPVAYGMALQDNEPKDCLAAAMRRCLKRRFLGLFSLEQGLEMAERACHPNQRLAWIVTTCDTFGSRAIVPMLKKLAVCLNRPRPEDEWAQALCWGLGRLGRDILLPIGERFEHAGPLQKDHYCQCLWYLGKAARGCQKGLRGYPAPWSEAVLYALEGEGAELLIEWRVPHVWLDDRSLRRIGALAFSCRAEERAYACRALSGWGPGMEAGRRMLQVLLCDPEPEVACLAWESMGPSADLKGLRHAAECGHRRLKETAQSLALAYVIPRQNLENTDETVRIYVALLALAPPSREAQSQLLRLLPTFDEALQVEVLTHLVDYGLSNREWEGSLLAVMSSGSLELRCLALKAYRQIGGSVEPLLRWCGDRELGPFAVEAVLANGSVDLILRALDDDALLRTEFLEGMRRTDFLSGAILGPEPDRLFSRVEELAASDELAASVLSDLDLEGRDWPSIFAFAHLESKIVTYLMRRRRYFPETLIRQMSLGKAVTMETLELLTEILPRERVICLLGSMFTHSRIADRQLFFAALWSLEGDGWRLLTEWIGDPNQRISLAAVQMMKAWLSRSDGQRAWIDAAGTSFLRGRFRDWMKPELHRLLAQAMLGRKSVSAVDWALALLCEDPVTNRLCRDFLTSCLDTRLHRRVIEGVLAAALAGERPEAWRMLRLWIPLEEGIVEQILASPRDPDEEAEFARQSLLKELSDLRGR